MRPCGFMPPGRFCVLMWLLRVMLARSHSPVPLPAAFVSVTRQPTTETEVNMAIINLRDYYPFYTSDCFMEVSEEVAEMFKEFDRKEAAYRLRTYRHKAYYSLDRDDGLEHEAVFVALSPHELYERKVTMQELHAAIASLPDKQAKRIYAHFILGMMIDVHKGDISQKALNLNFYYAFNYRKFSFPAAFSQMSRAIGDF